MLCLVFCLLGAALAQNPFDGHTFYVNPSYQAELDTSIASATGAVKTTLQSMRTVPSAYWIDVKGKIRGTNTTTVEGILKDAAGKLVVFIVYDLPNRDCHAKASNGEICCTYNADRTCNYDAGGDCAAGLTDYRTNYIDPLAALFKQYCASTPIRLVIEPDSLPNLATNMGDPHCSNTATQASYTKGIAYAITTIHNACPSIPMYVDAGHGGWLGWTDNMEKFATVIKGLGISQYIRGFATNVANYQPIGTVCPWMPDQGYRNAYCLNGQHQNDLCCADPCRLEGQWNPANNEMNYVLELSKAFASVLPNAKFIVDTGRNGVGGMRADCANWCNIRGAGIGRKPTTSTGSPLIEAFYWLKTPGESDGCTQQLPSGAQCKRFDSFCGSADSLGSRSGEPRSPEAGNWFDFQVKMLAQNVNWTLA